MRQYSVSLLLFLLLQVLPVFAKSLLDNIELSWRRRSIDVFERAPWVVVDKDRLKHTQPVSSRSTVKRTTSSASAASSFNEQAFNQSATQACTDAVSNYPAAVNPSGIVACYNIAFWDNSTGVFQTDVRFYQKSDPVGAFVGVQPSDYTVSMSIPEATLSAPQMVMHGSLAGNQPATGQFLQGFQNIGQLSESLQYSKLTVSDLRILMIPDITIAAVNPSTNALANTSLASDTISYVAGQLVQTGGTPTNITFPDATALAAPVVSSVSKFVLPGTHIKVFPTGLIITCIWTGLFGLAVGGGTIGRYQFRQAYRRRVQLAQASTAPRGI
ncbi:hypothetical protein VTN77DRAFT_6948 [Rasamsonia byssochlamydoides]|uniref:uncharacterized protein n=1 Tax=Rasamsonia byssochlamydoides TaxID=89139 RepID=UPI003743BDAC